MRTQTLFPLLPLLTVAAFPVAAADPALLDLVAPETALIAGMDFEKVRESPFGRYVLGTMNVTPEAIEKFAQVAGFDPMKDLREVIVATIGGDPKADGLILIRGNFDQSKLVGLAGLQGATIDAYQGIRLLTGPANRGKAPQMSVALMPGGVAIAPKSVLEAAIDRSVKGQRLGREAASRVQEASTQHDLWLVTQGSPSKLAPRMRSQRTPEAAGGAGVEKLLNGSLFQGIEGATAGVKFGANVVLAGEATARTEQDATALGDVMKFLSSMVASNAPAEAPPALLTMLGTLQTSSDGRTFRFSMSAPQAEFERMIKGGIAARARPVVHR